MTCSQKVDLPLPGAPISNTTMGFPCPSPSVYNSLILLSKMDHVDDFWKTLKSETQKRKKKKTFRSGFAIHFGHFGGVV